MNSCASQLVCRYVQEQRNGYHIECLRSQGIRNWLLREYHWQGESSPNYRTDALRATKGLPQIKCFPRTAPSQGFFFSFGWPHFFTKESNSFGGSVVSHYLDSALHAGKVLRRCVITDRFRAHELPSSHTMKAAFVSSLQALSPPSAVRDGRTRGRYGDIGQMFGNIRLLQK